MDSHLNDLSKCASYKIVKPHHNCVIYKSFISYEPKVRDLWVICIRCKYTGRGIILSFPSNFFFRFFICFLFLYTVIWQDKSKDVSPTVMTVICQHGTYNYCYLKAFIYICAHVKHLPHKTCCFYLLRHTSMYIGAFLMRSSGKYMKSWWDGESWGEFRDS